MPASPRDDTPSSPAARCAVVARPQAFSCQSPTSATTTLRPVFAEPSLVSRSALGSPYVPHHITSSRLRHPWGRGVWGKRQANHALAISICGELRCCCRVMFTASHLGLRRDMNAHYCQRPGEEREKPTQSASGSPDSVPNTPNGCTIQSHLSESITLHHHHQYSQCFALLCFSPPVQRKSRPHSRSHHKSIKLTLPPSSIHPLQSVIDHLPSIGKTQWGEVVCSLTAKHGFTKQMQAYLPRSPNPTRPRERRNASLPCITQHDVRQGPTTVYRLSEYQDFECRCRAD